MRNFLALLGWSPGNDQELFDDEELIAAFSLNGISKANAVFNPDKLAWFNAQYIARLPHEKWCNISSRSTMKAGLWRDSLEKEESEWFRFLIDLYRPRAKVLQDFPRQSRMFLIDHVEYDPAAVEKFLKDEKVRGYLHLLADRHRSPAGVQPPEPGGCSPGARRGTRVKPGVLMNPCARRPDWTGGRARTIRRDAPAGPGKDDGSLRLRTDIMRSSYDLVQTREESGSRFRTNAASLRKAFGSNAAAARNHSGKRISKAIFRSARSAAITTRSPHSNASIF